LPITRFWYGNSVYNHADQLGSIQALTNSSGAVARTADYDAYGQPTRVTGSTSTPFGYAGEYTDAETGFLYLRARYYDPASQQFLTVDPLLAATEQAYNYAGGSPLNATDPSGLAWATEAGLPGGYGTPIEEQPHGDCFFLTDSSGCWWAEAYNRKHEVKVLGGPVTLLFEPPCLAAEGVGGGGAGIGSNWARFSGMLRAAACGKGNFGIGSATAEEAEILGQSWVGPNARLASDGKTWVSLDGLRQYRPPTYKPSLGRMQANLESRPFGIKQWQSNAHIDIVP
jgi:RHS repeat-associated protein